MAALTERSVLVTGAFGNVGRYVLDRLPAGQVREVAWVDLRVEDAVRRLVADTDPAERWGAEALCDSAADPRW